MTRLVLLVTSILAGAILAVAASVITINIANGIHESPVNQSLTNYGTR